MTTRTITVEALDADRLTAIIESRMSRDLAWLRDDGKTVDRFGPEQVAWALAHLYQTGDVVSGLPALPAEPDPIAGYMVNGSGVANGGNALPAEPAGAGGLREALEDRPHEHEWVEVTTLGDKQRRWICSSSELAGCRAERREVAATPAGAGLREALDVADVLRQVQQRLDMREMSVGPLEAYSKRSVRDVLDAARWAEYALAATPVGEGEG